MKRIHETFTDEEFKKLITIKENTRKNLNWNRLTWRDFILIKLGVKDINEKD